MFVTSRIGQVCAERNPPRPGPRGIIECCHRGDDMPSIAASETDVVIDCGGCLVVSQIGDPRGPCETS